MSQPSRTPPRIPTVLVRLLVPLAVLAQGLVLAACGGSNNAANAAASEQSRERQDEVKAADFARCLREHGVEASASGSGGQFRLQVRATPGKSPQTMDAAQRACQKYRPEPKKINLSPQEKVKREEELLRFAKCMREHGIDIHAEINGGAIGIQVHGHGAGGPNPESPTFQAAQKACSGLLPFKGGPGGPGAGRPDTSRSGGGGASGAALAIGG